MKRLIFAFALVCATASVALMAAEDWGFNYQAEIRDERGNVITGDDGKPVHVQDVTIRLYNASTQGTALWGLKYRVYCDDNGLFNVFLSDNAGGQTVPDVPSTGLADVIRKQSPSGLYVGLTVGAGTEILPRQRICAVPFANVAKTLSPDATALGNLTVAGNVVVTGSLTAASISAGLVPVPVGGIIIWTRTYAPDGKAWGGDGKSADGNWAICNGNYDTPNLCGRTVIGAGRCTDDNNESKTFGLGDCKGVFNQGLEMGQLPRHTHNILHDLAYRSILINNSSAQVNDNVGEISEKYHITVGAGAYYYTMTGRTSIFHGVDPDKDNVYKGTVGYTGSGEKHNNMPPYCAAYYIMRCQ